MGKLLIAVAASTLMLVVPNIGSARARPGQPAVMAAVRSCHYPFEGGYGPVNDRSMNIGGVSARNMSCSKALHAIVVSTLLRNGDIRTPHFGCYRLRTFRSFGSVVGADIRCVHRIPYRAFRFSWAT